MADDLEQRLLSAADHGSVDEVTAALREGADPNARDDRERTPLKLAAARRPGQLPIVQAILDAGADVDAQDGSRRTAVMEAILGRDLDVLGLLLSVRPDLSIHGVLGETALIIATSSAQRAVPLVLAAGADPNDPDTKGKTPLMWAVDPQFHAGSGSPEMVNALVDAGAYVNNQDKDGRTALMWSVTHDARSMRGAVLTALLERGATVDLRDNRGQTPLMLLVTAAADENFFLSRPLVEILIDAEADVNAADHDGRTVLARASGCEELIDRLKAAGAST